MSTFSFSMERDPEILRITKTQDFRIWGQHKFLKTQTDFPIVTITIDLDHTSLTLAMSAYTSPSLHPSLLVFSVSSSD